MAPHVYARVTGFGWTLLPHAPFRFERVPGRPRSVVAFHSAAGMSRTAALTCEGARPAVDLGEATNDLGEVLDLLPGLALDHWRVETTVFTARWPEGFAVESSAKPPGFFLRAPEGALIHIQGPLPRARLPALTAMVGPGQKVRRHGHAPSWSWVELEYAHEGAPWKQTHRVLDSGTDYTCVVTAQCPQQLSALVEAAADEVAGSLAPLNQEGQT
jgi:hypothetical protein